MFSWGIHVVQNGSTMILTVPMHWLAILIFSTPWLFVPKIFYPGHLFRNLLITAAILVFYGFFLSSTELIVDRSQQTVTLREFNFFHWSTQRYPLGAVSGLTFHNGSTTSRIDLQFSDGSIRPLSFQDQSGGKEKAMYEVNNFLVGR